MRGANNMQPLSWGAQTEKIPQFLCLAMLFKLQIKIFLFIHLSKNEEIYMRAWHFYSSLKFCISIVGKKRNRPFCSQQDVVLFYIKNYEKIEKVRKF